MYNNTPCKHITLEGLDGYINIETEQELINFIEDLDAVRILKDIKKEYDDFDIDNYL